MANKYPPPPDWKDTADVRFYDGAFTDVFVEEWSSKDWETFLDFVASGPWRFDFTVNGEPDRLPRTFRWTDGVNLLLLMRAGKIEVDCHFFSDDDFELTFDQRELKTQADYRELLEFMTGLAARLGRPVILCPENCRDRPLFAVG